MKLDDPDWQQRLVDVGQFLRPRLFVFDPLARMKAPGREENSQTDMAALIEFVRVLREKTGAAVAFVHHTGHAGSHMRGSSDLESVWETRLSWKKDGSTVELSNEHREAEAGPKFEYRIEWDHDTRTIRLAPVEEDAPDADMLRRVEKYLAAHPEASANDVHRAFGGRKTRVLVAVKTVREGGSGNHREPPPEQPVQVVPPGAPFRGPGTTAEPRFREPGPDDDIPLS